jgi:spore germination protein GerM
MKPSRNVIIVLAVAAGALVALGVVAFVLSRDNGDEQVDTASSSASTTATAAGSSSSSSSTSVAAGDEVPVRVYFARDEGVATAGRDVVAPAVARGAINGLLDGPEAAETAIGMDTEVPEDTELLGLDVEDGEATIDLTSDFASGGGSLSMQLRVAQVVFTLTQFDSIDTVTVHLDGEAVDGIGGEGVPADDLTRADFEDVTPLLLVESPVPGEEVRAPVEVTGISNTFEANVRYTLTGPGGAVLDDGFTTATAGTGTWGSFSFTTSYAAGQAGEGVLAVFQESAEDGSRQDVYEVPVRLG